ncbi:MAG: GDSL-type esterase/lipase family protein [Pedobacter sp.]
MIRSKRYIQYCIILMLSLLLNSANSQTTSWDSTYRPEIYAPQLQQFKTFRRSNKDVVFLGNSITHWTDWNELLGISTAKNRGIPGDITFGVLERLDEVVNGRPAKVFILIGVNDVARNIPDSVILNNYQRIIRGIKRGSPLTEIYFQTMLPTNDSFKKLLNHYKNDTIASINERLKILAVKENIGLIDLYSAFIDKENNLDKEYTFDGVHLTAKGYAKWACVLKEGGYLR